MSQDSTELVVAASGDVLVAPVGTPLPDTISDALDSAFIDLGYVTEDGATLTRTPTIEEFRAWQSRSPVRREMTGDDVQAVFSLEQWNADTVPLAFGGGAITEVEPGEYRFDLPGADDPLDERSLILRWADGDKNYLVVFPRGNVTEAVETQLVRNALAVLPITFKALDSDDGIAYWLTDDPSWADAS